MVGRMGCRTRRELCALASQLLTLVRKSEIVFVSGRLIVPESRPGETLQLSAGIRAMTLISKSKPASQLTPTAVQFG